LFLVDADSGEFVRVQNVEDLVEEAVNLAVVAAGQEKSSAQKEELRRLLMQQRDVMIKGQSTAATYKLTARHDAGSMLTSAVLCLMFSGVIDDIALMWRCFVEIWTHEERESGIFETIWNTKCTRRKRVVQSDQTENKKILDKFYDDLFSTMSHSNPSILRPQVVLDKAVQLQVYNGLFTTENGIRCHQASYRKYTESTISIQNVTSSRAEFEGKRWVFGWSDIPQLCSRAYMVSLFSEYASVGGAFHDRLTEKYSGAAVGGDESVNIMQMLISHPFITEPNDSVVMADQTKQKIAGMIQMASGAHSMFAGLSPPIEYAPKDAKAEYYTFQWPKDGLVKVCGQSIRHTDTFPHPPPSPPLVAFLMIHNCYSCCLNLFMTTHHFSLPTLTMQPTPLFNSHAAPDETIQFTHVIRFALSVLPSAPLSALGFTIKVVDNDVAFTQGLGTFIMSVTETQHTNDRSYHHVLYVSLYLTLSFSVHASAGSSLCQVRRPLAALCGCFEVRRTGWQRRNLPREQHPHQCTIWYGGAAIGADQASHHQRRWDAAQDL
jgi:hypothetical protein